jgi:hypothetical protein
MPNCAQKTNFYEYDGKTCYRKKITINCLENGKLVPKSFKTYSTIHGPIMAQEGKWIGLQSIIVL